MITIEFWRFVPTCRVIKTKSGHYKNLFVKVHDHNLNVSNEKSNISRLRAVCHKWLVNHYGFCVIYFDGINDVIKSTHLRICNHHKMFRQMIKHNINPTIEKRHVVHD